MIVSYCSLMEGVNLLVSSGTASAIAGDRLVQVKRKTARQQDTSVSFTCQYAFLLYFEHVRRGLYSHVYQFSIFSHN